MKDTELTNFTNSLIELVESGESSRAIARALQKSQTTIRHWLRKLGLKTKPKRWFSSPQKNVIGNINTNLKCDICGTRYAYKKGTLCMTCRTTVNRFRIRLACVTLLGGKCHKCKWQGNISGFDIHHLDQAKKTFSFADAYTVPWEKIKIEIENCELLCAICHRKEHSRVSDGKLLDYVYEYDGKLNIGERNPKLFEP